MKRRRFLAIGLAVLLTVITVSAVLAGLTWCSSDPVFRINGEKVSVQADLAPANVKDLISEDNPVVLVIRVPNGTDADLVRMSGDYPEEVEIQYGGAPGYFDVFVRAPHLDALEGMRVTVKLGGKVLAADKTRGFNLHVRARLP
jgi:hypothetical protein